MRIAFWGNFGALNLGNECVLAATVMNLRARIPDAEMIGIGRDPADITQRHGIAATAINQRPTRSTRHPKPLRVLRLVWQEAREWLRVFRFVGELDALLITGCGILSDLNEGTLGLPYELFKWSMMARLRGARLFYLSVGAETLSRSTSRRLIRWALNLAEYRSYRDANSAALLAECGVASSRDAVRPDLAFGLLPATLPAQQRPATDPASPITVAIGVIDYRGLAGGDEVNSYETYLDRLCSFIASLLSQGHYVRVIVGDFRYDDEVRLDLRQALARRNALPTDGRYLDEPAASFEVLLQQLEQVDFVVASRFHNVLLGLLFGKPAISLSYEAKHEALMQSMSLADYCQPIATIDVPKLTAQFQRLVSHAWQVGPLIAEQVRRNRSSLAEQFDEIVARVNAAAS